MYTCMYNIYIYIYILYNGSRDSALYSPFSSEPEVLSPTDSQLDEEGICAPGTWDAWAD